MAVQILNKLPTTANEASQREEPNDLTRLAKEVHEFESDPSVAYNHSAQLEHKHKLIYVLARAVLESLTKDDPFQNVPQLIINASETLGVFVEAIKETPDVLDYVLPVETTLETRGREPLWVWLFPRILTILGRRKYESLTEKIKDFFYASFQAVARSPKLWNMSSFFFTYLKECVISKFHHRIFGLSSLISQQLWLIWTILT